MNVCTFMRWWSQTFLRGKCLATYGRGTVPLQLLSNTFIMHVTGIGDPLGVRGQTWNISWSLWLIMIMCIIVGSTMILIMAVMFFGHIQILSSCLTRSPLCLCWIPPIRPTNIIFHCLSLSVTPLPWKHSLLLLLIWCLRGKTTLIGLLRGVVSCCIRKISIPK